MYLFNNNTIEDLIDLQLLPKIEDVYDLLYRIDYMKKSNINKNNFEEIINAINEDSSYNFKNIFKKIFQSKCVKSYYDNYEKWENYKNCINEKLGDDTFDRFYERIIYVPLPFFLNGFTDATLFTFIRSNARKYKCQKKPF